MISDKNMASPRVRWSFLAIIFVVFLAGCGSAKKKPAELPPNAALIVIKQVWTAPIGDVRFPLQIRASEGSIGVAASDGTVALFDAAGGRELWRVKAGAPIAAGVGGLGTRWSVYTRGNELLAIDSGAVSWRTKQSTPSYTPPLVAGGRIFMLMADRSVAAFDGGSGRRLWLQQRPTEPLALRQAGLLMPVGNTLVAGLSGRMVGMSPDNGNPLWEVAIASPRGTNDVERLVDVVDHVSRIGDVICARAFQAAVGCVDAGRGTLLWTKPANGFEGLGGDERLVFGTESDGTVRAWQRADGEAAWSTDRLKYRRLSAPLALGRSIAIGDNFGLVHFLSREDGSPLTRVATDGSPIAAGPVLAGDTLIVVTQKGGVFAFRPE
ncbi:MAG: outer membrane protein assembly factor BamB [Burkholderiales bacterium]